MPSILPHVLLPVLLGIAFLPVARKRLLQWAPVALVPDLDYFFAKEFHRAALSNIWIPLIMVGILVWMWRRNDPTARFAEWMWRPGAPGNLALATYFIVGHMFMDVFAGGISLFWPLVPTNLYIDFAIIVDTATNQPVVTAGGGTEPDIVEVSPVFTWWSVIDTAMLALTAVILAAWLIARRLRAARDPPPVVVRRRAVVAPIHKG